jgi:uncharacterized caspase-like protein
MSRRVFKPLLLACWIFICATTLHAAKEALLIANADYAHFGKLPNPVPDARQLSAALEQIGFSVNLVENASREQMLDALGAFEERLKASRGVAFFHYGGHGVQVNGRNYLIPADAEIPDEKRVATRALELDEIMAALDASGSAASIVVLDACRDNPLPATSTRSATRGLSVVQAKPKNSIIIYAAEAGSKAQDGLFTPVLANALTIPGRPISEVMTEVRRTVYERSGGSQTPGEYNQLFEQLVLTAGAASSLPPAPQTPLATYQAYETPQGLVHQVFQATNLSMRSEKILSFEAALAKANAGDAYAQAIVSIYYGLGIECDPDAAKSKEYVMLSAKQQNPLGIFRLAEMREAGEAMEQNSEQASQLMQKAKAGLQNLSGDPYAMTALATIYERENPTSPKARDLLIKASEMGYEPAKEKLSNLEHTRH